MTALTTLTYNQSPIHIRDEMLCLTDMWKAAGEPSGRAPSDWRALSSTQAFIEFLADSVIAGNSGNETFSVSRGGKRPGTWAHWQIGFAYAKYLSPEFHAWCNTAAREKLEGVARHHVTVAGLEATVRQVVGGIVKGVVNKALTETVAPVLRELHATHHVGAVTIDAKTAKEWLEEYGCLPEGRDGPVRKVSAALRDMARMSGIELSKCPWRNAWLFPTSLARPYMDLNGRAMIRLHNAAVKDGQSALRLPGLPSTLHRIAARRAARRMTDLEIAAALGRCVAVPGRTGKSIETSRGYLRDGARAIMQMWSDLETEETLTRFAERLESRRMKELEGAE